MAVTGAIARGAPSTVNSAMKILPRYDLRSNIAKLDAEGDRSTRRRRYRDKDLRPMKAGTIALTVALLAMLAFAIWGFFEAWKISGPVKMSVHGYIALGLAGGVTLLLGGGLMWLAFYSANKGWDDINRDGD
jgi:hypothetical protein